MAARPIVCSPTSVGALVARRARDAKSSAAPDGAVVDEQRRPATSIAPSPGSASTRVFALARFAHGERAARHEEARAPRGRRRATRRRVAHVDRSAWSRRPCVSAATPRSSCSRCVARERPARARSPRPARPDGCVTSAPARLRATSSTTCGSAALPRMMVSETFVPGAPRSSARPFEHRHVARRLVVDGADVVARLQPGLRGRRAVARRDDAQVVLARQLEPDVALGRRVGRLIVLTCAGVRYALSGSRPSASPCIAPFMTLSMFTLST